MARVLAQLCLLALVVAAVLVPAPALADSHVSVTPGTVDPTYATTLRVSGSGFQSITGGHGGIYVLFGTVEPGWQPSRGGVTGADYLYVPDSETKDNQGFSRYVAFPGSDTADSANGGTMSGSGSWSTTLVVPGAVFRAYDRSGAVRTVDCRKVTCGVITVGAHGVANSHNETFTPVRVATTTSTPTGSTTGSTSASPSTTTSPTEAPTASAKPRLSRPATLEVDRDSAAAGHVLAFTATGLPAGVQVSAVFDDGLAGAGPFAVGADGSLAGVISLPVEIGPGTHELRLYGVDDAPTVRFPVRAATVVEPTTTAAQTDDSLRAAWLFAGAAGLVLLVALVRLGVRWWRRPRAS